MRDHPLLDNPLWNSLITRHADCALGSGKVRRYVPEIAPFVAVEEETTGAEAEMLELVRPGETVGLVGIAPPFPSAWELLKDVEILQMVCESPLPEPADGPSIELLDESHIPAMLELTALVYPAYFRPGTARLGA